jgi:hypothetical protein
MVEFGDRHSYVVTPGSKAFPREEPVLVENEQKLRLGHSLQARQFAHADYFACCSWA